MDRDTQLGLLAAAILEGRQVDWPGAESTASDDDRDTVRELRLVAEIAAVHRALPAVETPSPSAEVQPVVERRWGHLRLLEQVGRGAFGEVHRAWDTQLDREVALKLLHTHESIGDPLASIGDPTRTVEEARLLARVRHPNVVTVHGAERREGRVGLWMEFIHGQTLHQIVAERGPLGAREATLVALDLCRALASVHAAGLLHRDLTARNVMREAGGRIVLMDFGAGRELTARGADETATAPREFAGTPLYLAPELFEGAPADQRTEIYGFGVLLFYLVTGAYPIGGRSLADVREAHRRRDRRLLLDLRADLPAAFVRVVERALDPDPDKRFQTIGAIEAALGETSSEATSTGPVLAPRRLWLMAGVGVAAIAAAVVLLPRSWNPDRPSSPPAVIGAVPTDSGVTLRKLATTIQPNVPSNPTQDGRYIAQVDRSTGDAVIADLATGQQRRLFIGKGDWSDGYASLLAISPDGRQVAVDWHTDHERGHLYLVGSDGQGKRNLLGDTNLDCFPYQFSQDGSQIVGVLTSKDRAQSIVLIATADGAVRTIKRLGDVSPSNVALSPDGRFIAYDYPENAESADRDIFLIDTHTGAERPLVQEPGHDLDPLWTPDGRSVLFLSDRTRTLSAWLLSVSLGHAAGEPQLLKENVGRVRPRGFSRDGVLHMQMAAGFAEVYIADLDLESATPSPVKADPISPRMAASNFYPEWSADGRFVAYASQRREGWPRKLWLLDTKTGVERNIVPGFDVVLPRGWSADGGHLLVVGWQAGKHGLYVVDMARQSVRLIEAAEPGVLTGNRLTPDGVFFARGKQAFVRNAQTGALVKRWDYSSPDVVSFGWATDGRSILSLAHDGRLRVRETTTDRTREWYDMSINSLGMHAMAPNGTAIAYVGRGKDAGGDFSALKLWNGGEARDLLKIRLPETFSLVGWSRDGLNVLVIRWIDPTDPGSGTPSPVRELWRVAIEGAPVRLNLAMDALRDASLDASGRRLVFNAGFPRSEFWVMENFLPAPK